MAKTIYMLRHQKAGIITSHAFTAQPTMDQAQPIIDEAVRLHGREGWVRVHECLLLEPGEVPTFPVRALGDGTASMPQIEIVAEGHVTNPEE